jgi:hypothetical protein
MKNRILQNSADDDDKQKKYTYLYVRHYDEDLYQKQKQNGMKRPNGIRECGSFKRSDFSDDIIRQFEKTRQDKTRQDKASLA